ncbi:MAG: AAA family ATPase [Sphingomonadales bacterium]|nr:AAA family ATPase [Sphingomonadales bacterium]
MTFRRGLIVGKFAPLHRGHVHLIEQALAQCDDLVLISYAKPGYPGCSAIRRRRWLATLFPQATRLVVDDAWLADRRDRGLRDPFDRVPDDLADPEHLHRRFTAWLSQGVLGLTCDAVFTSEDYGDGFAEVLASEFGHPVRHVCVDRARLAVPVSATAIRRDGGLRRSFLPPVVAADLPLRAVFLGAESTGKSTVCQALAVLLDEPMAAEYGRELWVERGGELTLPDMLTIGRRQVEREERLLDRARRVLLCDTAPLTTAFYSRAFFDCVDPQLEQLARRDYDLTFLCQPDIPFVQDGTRQDEAFRARQHAFYIDALDRRGIAYVPLSGDMATRTATARTAIAAITSPI